MQYIITARLDLSDAPEIRQFIESDKGLKKLETFNSKKRPISIGVEMTDVYILKIEMKNLNRTKIVFDKIKANMETRNIYGMVHWHKCSHDTSVGECVLEEVYTRKPEGVDR